MNDALFEIYSDTKDIIKRIESCCNEDHSMDKEYIHLIEQIKSLECTVPGIKERYLRRKKIIESFTPEQIDHICYQIGEWYMMTKPLLEGQHLLGYAKEKLKTMICGD